MIPTDPPEIVVREHGSGNQGVRENKFTDDRFLFRGEDPQMGIAIDAPRPSIWPLLPGLVVEWNTGLAIPVNSMSLRSHPTVADI
jgi:hypothetical protein